MCPAGASNYRVKGGSLDAKFTHKRTRFSPLAGIAAAYLANLIFGQLAFAVADSNGARASTGISVSRIVFVGPEIEMLGIDAQRIVAGMANNEAIWNRSLGKMVSDSVRKRTAAATVERAIPHLSFSGRSSPEPAAIALLDKLPESVRDGRDNVGINRERSWSHNVTLHQSTLSHNKDI